MQHAGDVAGNTAGKNAGIIQGTLQERNDAGNMQECSPVVWDHLQENILTRRNTM